MNCQIIHDSIHSRTGWTNEFALQIGADAVIGYGSVAAAGPWRINPALYEFFIQPEHRLRTFEAFANLLPLRGAKIIETQSNDRMLSVMLHVFGHNLPIESILSEDRFQTSLGYESSDCRCGWSAVPLQPAIRRRLHEGC